MDRHDLLEIAAWVIIAAVLLTLLAGGAFIAYAWLTAIERGPAMEPAGLP